MIKSRYSTLGGLVSAVVLLLLNIAPVQGAAELGGGIIRVGSSPRLVNYSWAYLDYQIRNPDPFETEVTISVRPEFDAQIIYEKVIAIGPNAVLTGRELICITPSERFILSLEQDGQTVHRNTIFAVSGGPISNKRIFQINDDMKFGGMSALAKSNVISERVQTTSVPGRKAPHDRLGFGDSTLLVMGYPDFAAMTAQQFAAIRNFVGHGGVLVFASPMGTLKAAATPLAPLFAADPVRIRHIEVLPELDAWGEKFHQKKMLKNAAESASRQPLTVDEGIAFVELLPREDAINTLSHGELPIITWRRFGLGHVGMLAVDPNSELMKASGSFEAVWEHCLSWSRRPFLFAYSETGTAIGRILNLLTGFRIPDAAVIRRILVGYFIVLVLLLGTGYAMHRQPVTWLVTAGAGILLTVTLFATAFYQNAERPEQSATIADFHFATPHSTTSYEAVSLLSKHDMRPSIHATAAGTYLRPLAPPDYAEFGHRQLLGAPLLVARKNDVPLLPNLNIQTLRPRTVATIQHSDARNSIAAPVLELNSNGIYMNPWPVPEDMRGARTDYYFVLSHGVVPAVLRDGKLTLSTSEGILRLNTLAREYEEFFHADFFPAPCLIMLAPRDRGAKAALELPDFEQRGFTTTVLPVKWKIDAGRVAVPSALIGLDIRDTRMRLYYQNRRWRESLLRQPEQYIPFTAITSPLIRSVDVDKVRVDLDIFNPGANIRWEVALAVDNDAALDMAQQWRTAVMPARRTTTVFEFDLGTSPQLLDPVNGRFAVLLKVYQDRVLTETVESERANAWRIAKFNISLEGSLPEQSTAIRF